MRMCRARVHVTVARGTPAAATATVLPRLRLLRPPLRTHASRTSFATFPRVLPQYPTVFDVRLRPRVVSSRTGTKDMQMVNISLRVLAHPVEEDLPIVFKDLGENWDDRVLPSIVNEVLKAVVAQHDAHQLLTQREEVSRMISEQLNERAADFHCVLDGAPPPPTPGTTVSPRFGSCAALAVRLSLTLHPMPRRARCPTDVSITHLAFGREFTRAIEAKQVAQQESERAKFVVAKAEQLKQAAVIRAEGESEAAQLISHALAVNGTGLIEVRRIDVRVARALGGAVLRQRVAVRVC